MKKDKFKVAFRGLFYAFKDQAVFIQLICAILALIYGFMIKLNINEWIIFILLIAIVLISEIFNTCIEKLCDVVEPEYSNAIKVIKDMSSGAVLLSALVAFIICIIITVNKFGGL